MERNLLQVAAVIERVAAHERHQHVLAGGLERHALERGLLPFERVAGAAEIRDVLGQRRFAPFDLRAR